MYGDQCTPALLCPGRRVPEPLGSDEWAPDLYAHRGHRSSKPRLKINKHMVVYFLVRSLLPSLPFSFLAMTSIFLSSFLLIYNIFKNCP